mgnify:CR=1 FL=1
MQTSRLILVGGGSRSGKSRYAVELARAAGSRLAFIATAQARDEEMRRRIDAHRAERGARFTTFEEPFAVARLLREQQDSFDAVIVDCLTLWVSNLLRRHLRRGSLWSPTKSAAASCRKTSWRGASVTKRAGSTRSRRGTPRKSTGWCSASR